MAILTGKRIKFAARSLFVYNRPGGQPAGMQEFAFGCLVLGALLLVWLLAPAELLAARAVKSALILVAGFAAGLATSSLLTHDRAPWRGEAPRPARIAGGAEETATFTYSMPPGSKAVVSAVTVKRVTPLVTIITPYYRKNELYLTKGDTARKLGYNHSHIVHSEDAAHNETLHSPESPYSWHGHLELPTDRVLVVLKNLLENYGPAPAETHFGRIAQMFEKGGKAHEYPDGARLCVDVCTDRSGLEFMVDLRRRWGDMPDLTEEEKGWVAEAAAQIRPNTGAQVISTLLKRFHFQNLLRWTGRRGHLQHYLARAGSLEGLEVLSKLPVHFDINAQRPSDGGTIAHIAKWTAEHGKTPQQRESGAQILEFAKDHGADPSVKNKAGETFDDVAGS